MNKLDTRVKIVSLQKSKDEKGVEICYGSLQIKMQGELDRETKERKEVIEELSYKAKGLVVQNLLQGQIYQISGEFHIYEKLKDKDGNSQNPDLILIIEKANLTSAGKSKQPEIAKDLVLNKNGVNHPIEIQPQILEVGVETEILEEETVPF